MEAPPPPRLPPPLHCLGGRPAPPDISADLTLVTTLPSRARDQLWEVLGPCLSEPMPRDLDPRIDRFCALHEIEGAVLARALKACRFLLRQASARDLGRELFAADVERLGGERSVGELLL